MSVSREAVDRTKFASASPPNLGDGTIVGRWKQHQESCQPVSAQHVLDARTGIEVPVEENIDVIQWVEKIQLNLSTMLLPVIDYVLFDEDDMKH